MYTFLCVFCVSLCECGCLYVNVGVWGYTLNFKGRYRVFYLSGCYQGRGMGVGHSWDLSTTINSLETLDLGYYLLFLNLFCYIVHGTSWLPKLFKGLEVIDIQCIKLYPTHKKHSISRSHFSPN